MASFDDWVRAERVGYHDRAVEALRKLLESSARPADLDRRIGIALRLLSLDPLQEDVHRMLTGLYAERGDRHLAVKQYLACRDVLRSELGLEPGVRTEQLFHRRFDAALWAGRTAVGLRPNCPVANAMLAKTLLYCGRPHEALSRVRRAIRMSPVYPPWFLGVLAAAYCDSGDLESAISVAKRTMEINANNLEARHVLRTTLIRAQSPDRAAAIARDIREIDPGFSLATYAEGQPYRNADVLRRLIEDLRIAGVPE